MDLNNIHHVFKSIVDDFNLEDGQNRGLHVNNRTLHDGKTVKSL